MRALRALTERGHPRIRGWPPAGTPGRRDHRGRGHARVDGLLAEVRGLRPEDATYEGAAASLQEVWVAVRAGLREVLERVSLHDIVERRLPRSVARLTEGPDAWEQRSRG